MLKISNQKRLFHPITPEDMIRVNPLNQIINNKFKKRFIHQFKIACNQINSQFEDHLHFLKNKKLLECNHLKKKLVNIKNLSKDRSQNKNFKFLKRTIFVKVSIIISTKKQNKCSIKVKIEVWNQVHTVVEKLIQILTI